MDVEYKIAETNQELIDLLMLRVEIFVVEQNGPHDEEPDMYDRESTFVLAKIGGEIVGTARFRSVGNEVKIERIAVKREYRRRGIGKGLVQHALQRIEAIHPKGVFLHAQTAAQDFYRKLGFEPVGERFVEAGIEHIKMVKKV
ncbi:MAG: GNAT family N-acetyltransferase [bacterium]